MGSASCFCRRRARQAEWMDSGLLVQVWVFRNAALRCLCIAFRGTEQVKWKDLVTGATAPRSCNPEHLISHVPLSNQILSPRATK